MTATVLTRHRRPDAEQRDLVLKWPIVDQDMTVRELKAEGLVLLREFIDDHQMLMTRPPEADLDHRAREVRVWTSVIPAAGTTWSQINTSPDRDPASGLFREETK